MPSADIASGESAIRALHATWIAAVNARDLDRLLTLMTEDVVFLGPGQAPFGRDGFRAGFTAGHQQFQIDCRSALDEIVVMGDVAYSLCTDSLSLIPRAGGDKVEMAGHRMTVYRRQADGRWLLARDAHTLGVVAG